MDENTLGINNPIVSYQFGLTEDNEVVLLFHAIGETGEKATLLFPDINYYSSMVAMLIEGMSRFEQAVEGGFEEVALQISEQASQSRAPDDASGIEN